MESTLKFFNPTKASFGRHESFALRYSWLTKGFQAFNKNHAIFSSDESTIELGVGKNVVNAIKYSLRATTILKNLEDSVVKILSHDIQKVLLIIGDKENLRISNAMKEVKILA